MRPAPLALGDHAAPGPPRGRDRAAQPGGRAPRPRLHQPRAARPVRRDPHAVGGFSVCPPRRGGAGSPALAGGNPVRHRGKGAFTTVDGDKCVMGRGDLVLTPPWTWHDHGNDSDQPMLWLDGLDLPMVGRVEGQFYEPFAEEAQPIGKPVGDSERRYGLGQLRPTWDKRTAAFSPLLNYKWDRTEEALRRARRGLGGRRSPFDDVAMEYINPHTGGSLMPTIACWVQLPPSRDPDEGPPAHRQRRLPGLRGPRLERDRRAAVRLGEGRPLRRPDLGVARARERRRARRSSSRCRTRRSSRPSASTASRPTGSATDTRR